MASRSQAVVAGILVALMLFILGLLDSAFADSAVLVLGYGFVGLAVLAWLVVVGREVFGHRT